MAVLDFNADQKYRAYHVLACLNRSFRNVFVNLGELQKTGILNAKQLSTFRGIAQEMQADVNYHSLGTLHMVEERDWGRFGQIRLDRDKGAREIPRQIGNRKKATGNRQ